MNQMGISKMKSVLETYAPNNLDWKVTSYPKETHTSVVFKGFYDGIRFIEEDYLNKKTSFHPRNVNFVKGKPVMLFYMNDNIEHLHYTFNSKEPTKKDSLYKGRPIIIKNEGVFKSKKITKRLESTKVEEILIKSSSPTKTSKSFS